LAAGISQEEESDTETPTRDKERAIGRQLPTKVSMKNGVKKTDFLAIPPRQGTVRQSKHLRRLQAWNNGTS